MKSEISTVDHSTFLQTYLKSDTRTFDFLRTVLAECDEQTFIEAVREVASARGWIGVPAKGPLGAKRVSGKAVRPNTLPRPSLRGAV